MAVGPIANTSMRTLNLFVTRSSWSDSASFSCLLRQGSKDSMCPLDSLADVRGRMSADNDLYVVEGGDHGLSVGVKALAAQELTKEEAETAALEAIASFVSPLC